MLSLSNAYIRNKRRIEQIDAIREEYTSWVVHFFGLVDLENLPRVKKLTMMDIEMLMRLYLRKKEAEEIQKKKQEERRQKELLDKLKMTQR